MVKCDLPAEEREAILHDPERWYHSEEDIERCRRWFTAYLFVDSHPVEDCGTEIRELRNVKKISCSNCQTTFWREKKEEPELWKRKHGDRMCCPYCGADAFLQNRGRMGNGGRLHDSLAVSFINVDKDGAVCMESGIMFYDWDRYSESMELSFIGKCRYYFRKGACMEWKRYIGTFYYREIYGLGGWEGKKNISEPFAGSRMYGFDGYGDLIGAERIKDSQLKYCAIEQYFREYHRVELCGERALVMLVPQYLAEAAHRPQIEMAVKLGMQRAVFELIRDGKMNARLLNWKVDNPADFVRLSKQEAKEFFNDPSLEFLEWYRMLRRGAYVKDIREAREIAGRSGFVRQHFCELCRKYGLSVSAVSARYGSQTECQLWTDYIDMAEKLRYDLGERTVLLPKNLRERHDAAAEALDIKEDSERAKNYIKRFKKLEKKYGYTSEGLTVVVPKGIRDIVDEGKTLHICVGGYANRHIEGATTILFIRRERRPERSFLCVEIDKANRIKQIHGYRNENYPHAVEPRVKYAAWLEGWAEACKIKNA